MTESVKNAKYADQVEAALANLTDSRVLAADDVRVWWKFVEYLVNLSEDDGWRYDGHSLTVASPMSRLVVRGTIDDIPHVVFSSGRTTTECMRSFLRKMDEGWLEWQKDRFRT